MVEVLTQGILVLTCVLLYLVVHENGLGKKEAKSQAAPEPITLGFSPGNRLAWVLWGLLLILWYPHNELNLARAKLILYGVHIMSTAPEKKK